MKPNYSLAWPDTIALILLFLILVGGDGMSDWPLQKFITENWFAALRIVLFVWIPLRFIDLTMGGPRHRQADRINRPYL